jgi:hypothetical protein
VLFKAGAAKAVSLIAGLLSNWIDKAMDVLRRQRLTPIMEVVFSTLTIRGITFTFHGGAGSRGELAVYLIGRRLLAPFWK